MNVGAQPVPRSEEESMATERKPYALGPEGWEGPGLPQSAKASFMGSPWLECKADTLRDYGAKAVFLGVPVGQGPVYRPGSRLAARAARFVSEIFPPFLGGFGNNVFGEFPPPDVGDVPMIPANAERSRSYIERYVGEIL